MTTYGDSLAGWMLGTSNDGTGLWAALVLFLAVLVLIAAVVILVRSVKVAVDAS